MTRAEEIKMFGETIKAMSKERPPFYGELMYACAILSDAQEVMKRNPELARQFINKAKWFMTGPLRKETEDKYGRGNSQVFVTGGRRGIQNRQGRRSLESSRLGS